MLLLASIVFSLNLCAYVVRPQDAAVRIQRVERGRQARKAASEKWAAAVRIQALVRGHVARQQVLRDAELAEEVMAAAAPAIAEAELEAAMSQVVAEVEAAAAVEVAALTDLMLEAATAAMAATVEAKLVSQLHKIRTTSLCTNCNPASSTSARTTL